jgi:hypothetical protein
MIKFYEISLYDGNQVVGQFAEVDKNDGKFLMMITLGSKTLHKEFVNRGREGFESMTNLCERFAAEYRLGMHK